MSHPTDAEDTELGEASLQKSYAVSAQDLPLSCPTHEMKLWNSHPRVYLPIEKTGSATCPYCGSEFVLEAGEATPD